MGQTGSGRVKCTTSGKARQSIIPVLCVTALARGAWQRQGLWPTSAPATTGSTLLMRIPALPFTTTNWSQVPSTEHPGETGRAFWRMLNIGDVRVRVVEYSPGYLADHWCDRGHILYVLEGELDTELKDGRTFKLTQGMSYQVSDFGDAAHRSSTRTGAKLFIVD